MSDYQNLVTSDPITTTPPATPDTEVVWFDGVNYYIRSESGVDTCISCGSSGTEVVLLDDSNVRGVGTISQTMGQTWSTILSTYSKLRFEVIRAGVVMDETTISTDLIFASVIVQIHIHAGVSSIQAHIVSTAGSSFNQVNGGTSTQRLKVVGII